jgi:hypothetical protein
MLERNEDDGRLMLGVGGVLFVPMTMAATYALLFELKRPQGPMEWGIRLLLGELAISAMVFFGVGFLWAVTGNRRLKKLLDTTAVRLAWILALFLTPFFICAAYGALFR